MHRGVETRRNHREMGNALESASCSYQAMLCGLAAAYLHRRAAACAVYGAQCRARSVAYRRAKRYAVLAHHHRETLLN